MNKKEFKRTISYVNLSNKIKAILITSFVMFSLFIFINIQILFYKLTEDVELIIFGFGVAVLIYILLLSAFFIYAVVLTFKLNKIIKHLDNLIIFQKFINKHVDENHISYRYLVSFQIDNIEREIQTERIHVKDDLKNKTCKFGYLTETNTLLVLETSYKYLNYKKEEIIDE